jgi:hypothetical protein
MNAHLRAAHHLSLCPDCAAEVEYQGRARSALRDSHPIRIPSALLGLLAQIPDSPADCSPEEQTRPLPASFDDGKPQDRRKRR